MPDSTCSCCKALWVKFVLTQKLTTSDAFKNAVVYDDGSERHFWQGEDPDPNDDSFPVYNLEETLTVPGVYQFCGEVGDIGLACLDESLPDADRYRIVSLSKKPPTVVRFKLTATLTSSGSAAAVIRTFNGTTYVDDAAIVVFDWYSITTQSPGSTRGMWRGIAGMEGFALKREVPSSSSQEEYDIIWMEQYARVIEFTLTENMGYSTASQASANVDSAFFQGISVGSTTTIHDDQDLFPRALSGAKGVAIRSEYTTDQPYFKVVSCQQMTRLLGATADDAFCSDASQAPLKIGSLVALEFSPFSQLPSPLPTQAENLLKLAGLKDDWLILGWDEAIEKWFVLQVQHHPKEFITGVRYNASQGCGAIQVKKQEAAVMLCKDETDWQDVIQLTEQEFVYAMGVSDESGSGQNSGTQSCALTITKAKVCGIGSPEVTSTSTAVQLKQLQVITGVGADSDSLYAIARSIFVVCFGAAAEYDIVGITECESGSGSGSGSGQG